MRALASPVLVFEAIIVFLAIPVALTLTDVSTALVCWLFGGLGVLCLVTPGLLRRPWGYGLGSVLQVAVIACGLIVPAMAFLGVVFAALWVAALRLGRRVDLAKAAAAAQQG
jgi:Protein of unknown function (DUF4233)